MSTLKEEKPPLRNLCPYQVLDWNKQSSKDKFTAQQFLDSNPSVWEMEEWNILEGDKIKVSIVT